MHYVCGFMFTCDMSKVALIKKLKPKWQAQQLNGIGGKVEPSELSASAMVREFREETGLQTLENQWVKFCILRNPGYYEVDFYFCFSDKVSEVRTIETEEVGLFDVNQLPDNIVPNIEWLIPMALSKKLNFCESVLVCEQNPVDEF